MHCPSCRTFMIESMANTQGASAYRSAGIKVFRCAACATTGLPLSRLAERLGAPRLMVRDTLIEREVEATRVPCGDCEETLHRVTLSWDADWVEVEHCPSCNHVLLGEGEYERLERIVRATVDLL